MIDFIFCCIGMLTLLFLGICIIGMYDILQDAKAERERKKRQDWRLP